MPAYPSMSSSSFTTFGTWSKKQEQNGDGSAVGERQFWKWLVNANRMNYICTVLSRVFVALMYKTHTIIFGSFCPNEGLILTMNTHTVQDNTPFKIRFLGRKKSTCTRDGPILVSGLE